MRSRPRVSLLIDAAPAPVIGSEIALACLTAAGVLSGGRDGDTVTARDSGGAPLASTEGRLLRAALRGDRREADRQIVEMRGGWPLVLLPFAFIVAARRWFDDRWDRGVVLTFARRFVVQAPGGSSFAVADAELMLRGFTGDAHLIAASSEIENLPELYYALLLALADELDVGDADVDELLAAAAQESEAVSARVEMPGNADVDSTVLRRYRRIHRRYLADADLMPRPRSALRDPVLLTAATVHGAYAEPASRAGRYLRSVMGGSGMRASADIPDMDLLRIARQTLLEALLRYLPEDPDVREIAEFVRLAAQAHPGQFHPMKAEYVVRLMMGEEYVPRDGINRQDVYVICALLLQVIFESSHRDDAALCMLIVEAEEMLAEMGKDLAS